MHFCLVDKKTMLIFATQTIIKGTLSQLTCWFFYVQKLIKNMAMPYLGPCKNGDTPFGSCLQRDIGVAFFIAIKLNANKNQNEQNQHRYGYVPGTTNTSY